MKKTEVAEDFSPKIIIFACNWSGYASADCAGTDKIQYPTDLNIIKIACSGRINPGHILKSFELGADGVLLIGCEPGNCHYISGNKNAEMNMKRTKELLNILGLNEQRFRLEWLSADGGDKFVDMVNEFIQQMRRLGKTPYPVNGRSK